MEPSVVVAIVAVAGVAALVTTRLRRVARDNRPTVPDPASTTPLPEQAPLSTADRRFQLLSFQGGSVPADLRPMLEELRRNGIEVDEETLRRKLTDGRTDPVVADHVVTDPVVSDHSPPDDPGSDGQPADGAGSEDP